MKFERPHFKDNLTEEQMNYFAVMVWIALSIAYSVGVLVGVLVL